jgi:hypothetical protein
LSAVLGGSEFWSLTLREGNKLNFSRKGSEEFISTYVEEINRGLENVGLRGEM